MWQRRAKTGRRNSYGVASIRRDTYNTVESGWSAKNGWWTINAQVVKRSGGQCEARIDGKRCTQKGKEVHHIRSLSDGGTTTMANLINLCLDCHNRRHRHLFRTRR